MSESSVLFSEKIMLDLIGTHSEGILKESLVHHFSTGGKRLRARLAIFAFESLLETSGSLQGREIEHSQLQRPASYWAAACEFLHNATLIHDDLQDGDVQRRGFPTVWKKFGKAEAINAGDSMFMLPFLAIAQMAIGEVVKSKLSSALALSALKTIRGQAEELELPNCKDISRLRTAYFQCIELKTSSLFELPVLGAALMAGLPQSEAVEIANELKPLGTLFQIQDDVLDLYGVKGRERVGNDLREGKISSLVVEHLTLVPSDWASLFTVLQKSRESTTDDDVRIWVEKFQNSGALKSAVYEISMRSNLIQNSKILQKHLRFFGVCKELLSKIEEPIQHVVRMV